MSTGAHQRGRLAQDRWKVSKTAPPLRTP
jgi:hypothetical protein